MVADPTVLYRLRDGVYAPDLLIVAVAELDLFTWLAPRGATEAVTIAGELGLAARPADVMLTYLTALGLLERVGDQVTPTGLGLDHLAAGSPYDLRPYFASVRERPGCAELLAVLRSGRPAAWASADAGQDWAGRLGDPQFAGRITAAMDARGNFLGPALADALHDLPVRRVLDIGGSSGVYACALAARMPVTGAVFERPPADAAARTLLAQRGRPAGSRSSAETCSPIRCRPASTCTFSRTCCTTGAKRASARCSPPPTRRCRPAGSSSTTTCT